jgi:hypothetical protein
MEGGGGRGVRGGLGHLALGIEMGGVNRQSHGPYQEEAQGHDYKQGRLSSLWVALHELLLNR